MGFGRTGTMGANFGRLGSSREKRRPLADSVGPALVDLNFEANQFWFNGRLYKTAAAAITAMGAGADNGDGTYTLGPMNNVPFPGYNSAEGTVVCEYFKGVSTPNGFAWTIQASGDNSNSWRLLAQNGTGAVQHEITSAGTSISALMTYLRNSARVRFVDVMKIDDFSTHESGEYAAGAALTAVPVAAANVVAMIGHRSGANKLVGTLYRWTYFPRAVAWEDRAMIARRSTDTITGATTFFNDDRSIVINGSVWAGEVSDAGSIALRRQGNGPYVLSNRLQYDDHDNPSFLRRSSDGRIIAQYSKHAADATFYQRVSINPDDMTAWGAETNFGTNIGATLYAYANLIEISDGIFTFPRAQATGDTYYTWGYSKSVDNGATWSSWTKLFAEPNQRSYTRVRKRAANRINIFCNDGHPAEFTPGNNSLYHLFYDAGTFKKTDGTTLGSPPYRPSTILTKVYDATLTNISSWVWDAARNADTNPTCVFATFPSPLIDHRYNYGRWDGSAWVVTQICAAGGTVYPIGDDGQPYYSGGVCIDQDDPSIIYCSREIGNDGPHRNGGWFQLFKGVSVDDGATWVLTQLTFEPVDHMRPWKPPGSNVLTYMLGSYLSYTNFSSEMAFLQV